MGTILDRIIETKRQELQAARARQTLAGIRARAADAPPPRDFYGALAVPPAGDVHVIAEIKRKSPSAGVIRADFDPPAIARVYHAAGATCLSVLTDAKYFDGRLEYIEQVRAVVPLPVLRKDFIIDAWQVHEARAAGADAVLLIGEVLPPEQIGELRDLAASLGMATLIEVHERETLTGLLERVPLGAGTRSLLGINNRDLKVQRTDLATTETLVPLVPPGTPIVSESGIRTREDVRRLAAAGARAVLIGETLMRAADIAAAMRDLFGPQKNQDAT